MTALKNPRRVLAGHRSAARRFQEASRANHLDISLFRVADTFHAPYSESIVYFQTLHRDNSAKARRQLLRVLMLQRTLESDTEQYQEWVEASGPR